MENFIFCAVFLIPAVIAKTSNPTLQLAAPIETPSNEVNTQKLKQTTNRKNINKNMLKVDYIP